MPLFDMLLLIAAGFAAGGMNALAGGGTFKVDILRACLGAGYCNVLITEERAAEALLGKG